MSAFDNVEAERDRQFMRSKQSELIQSLYDFKNAILSLKVAADKVVDNKSQPEDLRQIACSKRDWCERAIAYLSTINQL